LAHSFAQIDWSKINSRLDSGYTLVTATKRLSREIHAQYIRYKSSSESAVWETPTVLPYESWLQHIWKTASISQNSNSFAKTLADSETPEIVLNPLQSKAIWKDIIKKDIASNHPDTQPLWSVEATTGAAMQGWQISQNWQIDLNECRKSSITDYQRFEYWATTYTHHLKRHHWVDIHQLSSLIAHECFGEHPSERNLPQQQVVFVGFDAFTSQQFELLDAIAKTGGDIEISEISPTKKAVTSRRVFDSEYDQWLAAAHWAREKIETSDIDQSFRLAIVSPNLRRSRRLIEFALRQVLSPSSLSAPKSERPVFHISLGNPLAQFPVIKSAIELLSITADQVALTSTIQSFILSPYLLGSVQEAHTRSVLENRLRQSLSFQWTLSILEKVSLRYPEFQETPTLKRIIDNALQLQQHAPRVAAYSFWVEHFLEILTCFGWPSTSLESDEFQAIEAFKSELTKLGFLDLVSTPSTYQHALSILKTRLNEHLFEVESTHSVIEVMDMPESAGIDFDGIWFGGLTESDWPGSINPSPLIPNNLQKAAGYYRSSYETATNHACQQQARLSRQSDNVVLSYHTFEKEVELRPSTLLGGGAMAQKYQPRLFELLQEKRPEMEIYLDDWGSPFKLNDARGGTQLIQNQAACAFRSYAIHRLGGRDCESREQGLDALDRGQLVHQILENIWKEIGSSKTLKAMGAEEVRSCISRNIRYANNPYISRSGCDLGFFDAHSLWLEQLFLNWFEIESSRNLDFSVFATEKPVQLNLGDLNLSFKIDRIDQLNDNSYCLIDYKTGTAAPLTAWAGDRPKYPQLALYSLALDGLEIHGEVKSFSSLVVGQVKFGDSSFKGISADNEFFRTDIRHRGVVSIEKNPLPEELHSWGKLKSHWLSTLTRLADDFSQGHAEVNPEDSSTCEHCELRTFCRVDEKQVFQ
jgi:ATP-dependent helicase/nuclease subunit B